MQWHKILFCFSVLTLVCRGTLLRGADNDLPKKKSLGLQVYQLDQATLKKFGLAQQSGFAVETVAELSPAANAGLQRGDVIIEISGRSAKSIQWFDDAVSRWRSGDELELTILRHKNLIDPPETLSIRVPPNPDLQNRSLHNVVRASESQSGWKQIWSFSIPNILEPQRHAKYDQQEPGIAILPDGLTYLREGKIYDFATNKVLAELDPIRSDSKTPKEDSGGLFAFSPAGAEPRKPEKFDPGADFECPGGLTKPDILPLASSFYYPTRGLGQSMVTIQGKTIKPVGSLAEFLRLPETIAKEVHNWCFISPDQNRIVLGSGDRLNPKLLYVEFDPISHREIRRKATTSPIQVERVRFVEGSSSVILMADYLARTGEVSGAAIWDTNEIVARIVYIDLTKPNLKNNFDKNYDIRGNSPYTPFDVSPNGQILVISKAQVDLNGFPDTNLSDTASRQRLEAQFYSPLLFYNVIQQNQNEHRLPVGVSRIRFIDDKTLLISYFHDPRKAEKPKEVDGWCESPSGNNGLAVYDIETKQMSVLRSPVDNLSTNDIMYLDTAGGSLVAVHRATNEIRVDALSRLKFTKPAFSNLAMQKSSPFLPLFDDTTYYYEAKTPDGLYYYRRTFRKQSGENGDTWTIEEQYATEASERRQIGYLPPFPFFFKQGAYLWKLENKDGFLNQTILKGYQDLEYGSTFKSFDGIIKVIPITTENIQTWNNEFKEKTLFDTLNGNRSIEETELQKCDLRVEDSNSNSFMIVERQIERFDSGRPLDKKTTQVQEKYQRDLGLIEFVDNMGRSYKLKHIRSANNELQGHPMECTIYEGKESVSNGLFTMAFHSFQNGKFKGIFYPPSELGKPTEFEGTYYGDKLKFEFIFDSNQAASGFDGVFKNGEIDQIIGTFNLVDGRKVMKIDYQANRVR